MDRTTAALLESWGRQVDIVNRLANRIDEQTKNLRPSPEGETIAFHLSHMHGTRQDWLSEVSKSHAEGLGIIVTWDGVKEHGIEDLAVIRHELILSGKAIGDAVRDLIEAGAGRVGPYSHPVHFLEHMVWHDGWHYGLIALALRLGGQELPGEWEEANAWGIWRS